MKVTSIGLITCAVAALLCSRLVAAPTADAADANGNELPEERSLTTAAEKNAPTILTETAKYFLLRKTFLTTDDNDKNNDEPASLSWTKAEGEASFYAFDLAIGLNPDGFTFLEDGTNLQWWDINWQIKPTFEAHTSTETKAAQDSLSARLPIVLWFQPNFITPVSQHKLAISAVYEMDQHNDTATFGGDVFYTPTIPAIGAGIEKDIGPVAFRWRPFIGFEGGHILENNKSALDPSQNEFCRFAVKVHGDVWIGKQFLLAADYSARTDLIGNLETKGYFEISPTLYIDKEHHLSTGLTYKRGKTTPDFKDVNSINIWLGVLF